MMDARKSRPAGALSAIALAVIAAGCASGGAPAPTPEERDALLARYAGDWVLDEEGSSPQIGIPRPPGPRRETMAVAAGDIERVRRELEAELQRTMALRNATFGVLRVRPARLSLRVAGDHLVYTPAPGPVLTLPLNGSSVGRVAGELQVRTQVAWDGPRLALQHLVASDDRVTVVLEIVDGRLQMIRTVRLSGEAVAPIVLVYDRAG